jgi:hypothetical protein
MERWRRGEIRGVPIWLRQGCVRDYGEGNKLGASRKEGVAGAGGGGGDLPAR